MSLTVDIKHNFADFSLNVQFSATSGITALFGPSGSGKTSIIRAIAGLLKPDEASIYLHSTALDDSQNAFHLATHQRNIGYVFQEDRLFGHLTVAQNMHFGARFKQRNQRDSSSLHAEQIITLLGIEHLLNRRPASLSGGEKQRVSIGRALLNQPQLLLADEPLSALDEARKQDILPYFEKLRDELKIPILYVSHSITEVARLANEIVVLDQGRVIRQGSTSDILSDPAIEATTHQSAGAVLDARISRHHEDGLTELEVQRATLFIPATNLNPGESLRVRIPANDVILSTSPPDAISALNVLPGTIQSMRTDVKTQSVLVALDTDAGTILARVTQRSCRALNLAPGLRCFAITKSVAIAAGTDPLINSHQR